MIPTDSKIGQGMRIHFEKLLNECGKNELIPVYLKNDTPNFYLNREVKSEETHSVSDAEQCFEKESQTVGKRVVAEQCACKSNFNRKSLSNKIKIQDLHKSKRKAAFSRET